MANRVRTVAGTITNVVYPAILRNEVGALQAGVIMHAPRF